MLECVPLTGKTADLESNHLARGQTRLILEALHASLALPYGTSANRKGLQPFLLFNTSSRKSVNAETLAFLRHESDWSILPRCKGDQGQEVSPHKFRKH